MARSKIRSQEVWKGYFWAVATAVGVALAIRFFVVEAYRIPTSMMRPSLEPGDVIFASKLPFGLRLPGAQALLIRWGTPKPAEVVVFSSNSSGVDSIRRVIGLPGDTVGIKEGRILLNGKPLGFLPEGAPGCGRETLPSGASYSVCFESPALDDQEPEKVPEGQVFLVGDLRKQIQVSHAAPNVNRSWAMVSMDQIKAKALWIWLSIDPEHSKIRTTRLFKKIR